MNSDVLVVVPARGGSKGIPRKNLRRLNGRPLITYVLETISKLSPKVDLLVSSEDEEIINFVEQLGVETIQRPSALAEDHITLDSVIYHAMIFKEKIRGKKYKYIATCQPTSPLIKAKSLALAIETVRADKYDTLLTVVDDTHLTWSEISGEFKPNYTERLNRQYMKKTYRETGGFLISSRKSVSEASRFGRNIGVLPLEYEESFDIDNECDWAVCEYLLKRKRFVFSIVGNARVGLGHVYNSLILASDLIAHDLVFVVDENSRLAYEKIKSQNYRVVLCKEGELVETINSFEPDVVVNDRLDTDVEYMKRISSSGRMIINFEDLGEGGNLADAIINAIYPESICGDNHFTGHEYYLLRDEFSLKPRVVTSSVSSVLLSFGGTDPASLTEMVLEEIMPFCKKQAIEIVVVLGFGKKELSCEVSDGVTVIKNTSKMSYLMDSADVIFTSAGRTIYEVASMAKPAIVLCQNTRELTHAFASSEHGFINLGLGVELAQGRILDIFRELISNFDRRKLMVSKMNDCDLRQGRKNVLKIIDGVIEAKNVEFI